MSEASRWAEVEKLYHQVVELDAAARRRVLEALPNDAVRQEVESLLAHDSSAESFLEQPAMAFAARHLSGSLESKLEPGSMVGPYRIVQQVGRGGMGVVYEAEQQHPVKRPVALKMIKAGMDSEQVVSRFQAERQALAMMDHPNIARVLDAGATEAGRPFFVMELVNGVPLTDYCTGNQLDPRERLALFVPICRAIQHAHQKGIIHRDIKPSNLLVARYDGKPLAKVIDFGIAKAMQDSLADRSLHTQAGAVIGTLEYMSPEQAGPAGFDIDTRSDVYALGAVLYELITGKPPLHREGLQTSSQLEMLLKIRDEDPPAPSSRIPDAKVARAVRGDLDWVVMRALEKDRLRRYQSAAALADDIENYLQGEPVNAAPPSAAYRFRRMATRHRGSLVTAAAFLVVVLLGAAFSVREAIRARRAEQQASAVSDFLQNGLLAQVSASVQASSSVRPDPDLKVRTALDRAAQRIAGRFPNQPLVEASLRQTIASAYLDLGLPKDAETHLRRALDLRRAELGERSAPALESGNLLALALLGQDRPKEAEAMVRAVWEARRQTLGERHPDTLTSLHNLAAIEQALGRDVEAEARYQAVVQLRRRALGEEHPDTLKSMNNHGLVLGRLERHKPAIGLLQHVIELRKRVLGDEHPETMESRSVLARAYFDAQDAAKATPLLRDVLAWQRRVLGAAHPDTVRTRAHLGLSLGDLGNFTEADTLLAECTQVAGRTFGQRHALTEACRNNWANALNAAGQYAQAEQLYREVLQSDIAVRGADSADALRSMSNLAINLGLSGKHQEGESLFRHVVAMRTRVLGPDHPKTLSSMNAHAHLLRRAGKLKDAERTFRQVVALRQQVLGPDHGNTRYSRLSLAETMLALEEHAEAGSLLQALAKPAQASQDPWMEAMRQSLLGASLAGQKRYQEAEPLLRSGYELLNRSTLPLMARPELRGEVERARQRLQQFQRVRKASPQARMESSAGLP